jgi:uncharacterized integral membrane protein
VPISPEGMGFAPSNVGCLERAGFHQGLRGGVTMRFVYFLFLLLILAAVAVFAYQNDAAMTITFLNWHVTSSIALIIAVIYVLGMVSGWTVVGFLRRSIQRVTERRAS